MYFRGIGQVYVPLIATTLHISIRVILSYLLAPSMGLRAVAVATGVGWMAMTVYQVLTSRKLTRKMAEGQ